MVIGGDGLVGGGGKNNMVRGTKVGVEGITHWRGSTVQS